MTRADSPVPSRTADLSRLPPLPADRQAAGDHDRRHDGRERRLFRVLGGYRMQLRTALRPADTIARFGGDEFVVLCEDLRRGRGCDRDRAPDRRSVPRPDPARRLRARGDDEHRDPGRLRSGPRHACGRPQGRRCSHVPRQEQRQGPDRAVRRADARPPGRGHRRGRAARGRERVRARRASRNVCRTRDQAPRLANPASNSFLAWSGGSSECSSTTPSHCARAAPSPPGTARRPPCSRS